MFYLTSCIKIEDKMKRLFCITVLLMLFMFVVASINDVGGSIIKQYSCHVVVEVVDVGDGYLELKVMSTTGEGGVSC